VLKANRCVADWTLGAAMDENLSIAQSLKYAEGLRELVAEERAQRSLVQDTLERLHASYRTTVRTLAGALELRDDQTGDHATRVSATGLRLARAVAPDLAADPQLEYGFLLHDLGKIGVPDAILLKPGSLTDSEMQRMAKHPLLGARLLEQLPYLSGTARDVVLHHHERWSGAGYPHGLRGEQIPLAARVFALADAFDAMTNDRPYRRAMQLEHALAEISAGAGAQFDPELARVFVEVAPELRRAA
jgi:HD-GYP domain-containing protein (c-di-GMP phosphodiesterase class II)